MSGCPCWRRRSAEHSSASSRRRSGGWDELDVLERQSVTAARRSKCTILPRSGQPGWRGWLQVKLTCIYLSFIMIWLLLSFRLTIFIRWVTIIFESWRQLMTDFCVASPRVTARCHLAIVFWASFALHSSDSTFQHSHCKLRRASTCNMSRVHVYLYLQQYSFRY